AQIVVGVRIFSVGLDGVLEIFLGLLVALDQQFRDSHLIKNHGITWLLGKSGTVVIQRIKVILLSPQCIASFLEVFGTGLLRRRLGPVQGRGADLDLFRWPALTDQLLNT